MFLFAGGARAYVSVDADASVRVESRITRLDIGQEVGSERIECSNDGSGGVSVVNVVRIVKTRAAASAEAQARAACDAHARYSDSCSCSGGGSCSTSGSGSDSDSASKSDSISSDQAKETKFTVARASADKLREKGFAVSRNSSCEITDPAGYPLNPLGAIAVVTWIYGEELIKENPLAMNAVRNLFRNALPAAPGITDMPVPGESMKRKINFDRSDGGMIK